MTTDEVEIVRVFTRNVGGTVPDSTIALDAASNFEVIVEAEAGSNLVGFGVGYTLTINALDLTEGTNPKATEANFTQSGPAADNFGGWASGQNTQKFTVSIGNIANVKNHVFKYVAMLRAAGAANEAASFAESPMFTIIK